MMEKLPTRLWIVMYVVTFAAILLTNPASAAAPPSGFRNFSWGAPISGPIKKLDATNDGTALYIPKAGKALAPFLGIPVAEEMYSFTYGKFYNGSVWLDGQDNFARMKDAIIKQFGAPTYANGRIFKWKWSNSKIEVHLYYQAKFTRTTVTYLNNAI